MHWHALRRRGRGVERKQVLARLGFPIEEFLAALIFACKAGGAILVPAFDLVKPAGQTIGADVLSRAVSRNDEVEPAALVERMARTGRLVGRSGEAAQRRRRFLGDPVIEALRRRGFQYLPAETRGDRNSEQLGELVETATKIFGRQL